MHGSSWISSFTEGESALVASDPLVPALGQKEEPARPPFQSRESSRAVRALWGQTDHHGLLSGEERGAEGRDPEAVWPLSVWRREGDSQVKDRDYYTKEGDSYATLGAPEGT